MAATGFPVAAVADPPAVAEPSALKHVPVCAQELAQKGLGPWKGVVMKAAAIVLSGGFGGTCSHVAETVLYRMDGEQWRFVHLHKGARWFLNGCSGPKAVRGISPRSMSLAFFARGSSQGRPQSRKRHPQSRTQ